MIDATERIQVHGVTCVVLAGLYPFLESVKSRITAILPVIVQAFLNIVPETRHSKNPNYPESLIQRHFLATCELDKVQLTTRPTIVPRQVQPNTSERRRCLQLKRGVIVGRVLR